MLGSLVVLLPFDRTGGNVLLRHRGHEHDLNGPALLKGAPPGSAAYIAFFGDVEHEVAQVTSGYRVTITYNLYFDSKKGVPITQVPFGGQLEHPFKTALRTCLDNAATQPFPASLGFGLEHAYALFDSKPSSVKPKGSDATLVRVLTELNIEHKVFLPYRKRKVDNGYPFRDLSTNTIEGHKEEDGWYGSVLAILGGEEGSFLIWDKGPQEVAKNPPWGSAWYRYYAGDKKTYKRLDVKWLLNRARNV